MTGPTRDDERRAPGPRQLDYAPPEGGLPKPVALTLGILIALVIILPLTFFAPFAIGMAGAVFGPVAGIVIVATIATGLKQSEKRRAMAAGMLTGAGIAILIDGVCWIAISSVL